jgi:hypothetical protein
MKKMSRLALIVLAVASVAPVALADVTWPRPRPHRKQKTRDSARMVISNDDFTQEALLQIPRSMLKQIVAELGSEGESDLAAATAGSGSPGLRTTMAGVFLSLSFAFGGIWLVRSRGRGRKTAAAAMPGAVAVVGITATTALADIAPGPFGGGGSIVNVLVAGFFLAASIAFGGIWLARYRRREGPKRKAVLVVVLVVMGLVAVLALADLVFVVAADARVPDRYPLSAGSLTRAVPNGEALSGEVRIRIADEGDQITLTLPKPR